MILNKDILNILRLN